MGFIISNISRPIFLRATFCVRCISCKVDNGKFNTLRADRKSPHFRMATVHSLQHNYNSALGIRLFSQIGGEESKPDSTPPQKLGIVARFKQMYRDYWYVLIPVHVVTSTVWYGSFYVIAEGGVDIVQLLTWMGFSDTLIEPFKSSSAGYFAIAYALYKVATPLRYAVTIGGTTVSINYLRNRGYIKPKPIPSTDQIKEMYKDRRQELVEKTNQIREKKDTIKEDLKRYQIKIQDIKDGDVKSK